jgi:hypothetical protein
MTLHLNLPPPVEKKLRAMAQKEGRPEEQIALDAVARFVEESRGNRNRNVLDFEGVGRDNPVGMDAQEYVNAMRDEWDR